MKVGISSLDIRKISDGISVYTNMLAKHIKSNGVDVSKVHSVNSLRGLIEYPSSYYFPLGFAKSLMGLSTELDPKVDIYHVTDYKSIRVDCPTVSTLHDAIPLINPEYTNPKYRQLKNIILKKCADFSDRVIAVSNYSVSELVQYYQVPEKKIEVIHSGVDQFWFNRPTVEEINMVKNKYQIQGNYFISVGTIQPRKNYLNLIRAHNMLNRKLRIEFPLLFVGKCGCNSNEIKLKIKQKILLKEAVLLDSVTNIYELKCLYSGAAGLLYPSLYEGFGLPILESFALGTPVLTSNVTSMPEISAGIGIEVDPLSPLSIAEGIEYIISNADRSDRVALGLSRAKELSWDKCALKTIELYRSIL